MIAKPISYIRFRPTPGNKSACLKVYDKIHMRAPQNSELKFRIEKQGKIFVVYGSVHSSMGVYIGYAASNDLYKSLASMGGQLERRLDSNKRGMEKYETSYRKSG